MQEYANTSKSDYRQEKSIVQNHGLKDITEKLRPFYSDSRGHVRQKAYYLTYKKGITGETRNPTLAIHRLIAGSTDKNSGIAGQNIQYLQHFRYTDFDRKAKKEIAALLTRKRMAHYKEMVLLAGFVGTGKETLYAKYLDPKTPEVLKWHLAQALARMGEKEQARYCLEQIKKQPVNNETVSYLIPVAIYTRQKEAINYCVEILGLDKELCHSPNPDSPGRILCGYRVMELLAPVIEKFPIKVDATGSITGIEYEKALETARDWFKQNEDYKLVNSIF